MILFHIIALPLVCFLTILFWNAAYQFRKDAVFRAAAWGGDYQAGFWKRVRYARLFVLIAWAVRERRWGSIPFTLKRPFEWFEYGSGIDSD